MRYINLFITILVYGFKCTLLFALVNILNKYTYCHDLLHADSIVISLTYPNIVSHLMPVSNETLLTSIPVSNETLPLNTRV